MSEPIKIGDLVMFTHWCCDQFSDGATIFTVASIRPSRSASCCSYCRKTLPHDRYAADAPQYPGAPFSWLKKIDPPQEKQDERHDEEITA